jgi:hypothetical protein
MLILPPLDADLAFILGRPNFACGSLAHAYRADGAEIPQKAEAEQAFVIHKMLGYYLADPATWRDRFQADIDAMIARRQAAANLTPAEGA